jgi:hypothetical protein
MLPCRIDERSPGADVVSGRDVAGFYRRALRSEYPRLCKKTALLGSRATACNHAVPTWAVPAWAAPTWAVPTWAVPTWAVPTWAVPTWAVPTTTTALRATLQLTRNAVQRYNSHATQHARMQRATYAEATARGGGGAASSKSAIASACRPTLSCTSARELYLTKRKVTPHANARAC